MDINIQNPTGKTTATTTNHFTESASTTTMLMTSDAVTVTSRHILATMAESLGTIRPDVADALNITGALISRNDTFTEELVTTESTKSFLDDTTSEHTPVPSTPRDVTRTVAGFSTIDPTKQITSFPVTTTDSETPLSPTHSDVTTSYDETTPGGLSQGAIIGIAVGACAVVIIIIIVFVYFMCRNKNKDKRKRYLSDDNLNDYKLDLHAVATGSSKPDSSSNNHSAPATVHFDNTLTGNPDQAMAGVENTTIDINTASEANKPESEDGSDVTRRDNRYGPNDRAIMTASRYSLGPVMLGEDGPVSTSDVYTAMYSTTNTFK